MNIIEIPGKEIGYPVGLHMPDALLYIDEVAKYINENIKDKTIHVFCIGSSGAILASLLYSQVVSGNKLYVCHIKKVGENSHSGHNLTFKKSDINIIIDDFSYTGTSLENIYNAIGQMSVIIDYLILSKITNGACYTIANIIKPLNVITTIEGRELSRYVENY